MDAKNNQEKKTIDTLTSSRFRYKDMSDSAVEECEQAMKKHRSDISIKEWREYSYFKSDWCEQTLKNAPTSTFKLPEEKFENLSLKEFREKYESKNLPVKIIGGLNNWKALESWDFDVRKN